MTTILQLASWIVANRKGKVFNNYTMAVIIQELLHSECVCVIDDNREIVGVACGDINAEKKEMYIYDVLTTHKKAFRRLLQYFKKKWPDYTLKGKRKNGKEIAYNVDKLLERIK